MSFFIKKGASFRNKTDTLILDMSNMYIMCNSVFYKKLQTPGLSHNCHVLHVFAGIEWCNLLVCVLRFDLLVTTFM